MRRSRKRVAGASAQGPRGNLNAAINLGIETAELKKTDRAEPSRITG